MARSPAHKLGQIIGERIEVAIREPLRVIAEEFDLYLDYKHARPARGRRKKVSWCDLHRNSHDLDYVLEAQGSEDVLGRPKAFIETAWRRYTKHSRNKVQEIQGAVLPLAEAWRHESPFLGAVLAGDFTEQSLNQLKSHGFNLAYCPYEMIMQAFGDEGFDMSSEEDTSEAELLHKADAFGRSSAALRRRISRNIRKIGSEQLDPFFDSLRKSICRRIEHVVVLTLSGPRHGFGSIVEAIEFVTDHDESAPAMGFVRYELSIRYSNGDEVRGDFREKEDAVEFLRSLEDR